MGGPSGDLQSETGAVPPPAIAELDAGELERLRAAVATARAAQNEALERAIDDGLGFLPRLLRGAVKRALLG